MKKLLFSILLMPMFCTAQDFRFDTISKGHDTGYHWGKILDTSSKYFWHSISIKGSFNDTIYTDNIVGTYEDQILRMFNADYLIISPTGGYRIIGANMRNINGLLDIYSYQTKEGSIVFPHCSICTRLLKGDKKGNWKHPKYIIPKHCICSGKKTHSK